MKFKIYTAHPITTHSGADIITYFVELKIYLSKLGYDVLHPMIAKGGLKDEIIIKPGGYDNFPMATNHAIKSRDYWMIRYSDIVLVDLSNTKTISIGCVSEIAVANVLGKHIVLVLEAGNIHFHPFIVEGADVIVSTLTDALIYLKKLITVTT